MFQPLYEPALKNLTVMNKSLSHIYFANMGHLGTILLLLLGLAVAVAQAAPKAVKPERAATCKIKNSPCYNFKPYCPTTCPTDCYVDCTSCQPVCGLAPSPPPPPPPPPPKPAKLRLAKKCKDKKSSCYNLQPYCPTTCPKGCNVDCTTCKTVCIPSPPPPPPPPPKPVKPSRAKKCTDKNSPCFNGEPYCPTDCPTSCHVDCNSCKTVCGPKTTQSPPPPPPPPVVVPTPSPPPVTSGSSKARCMNKKYPSCIYREHTCPPECPTSCEVNCVTCSPVCNCDMPGAVCQDPKFIGADGITFYFHGKKEQDFCLVTDSNLHINGHFIGRRNPQMKRDFTWVQSLGILFDSHKLYLGARKTAVWNDAVDRLELVLDGEPVALPERQGASWSSSSAGLTITRTQNANAVVVEAEGNFKIKAAVVPISEKESVIHNYGITSDDCFAHLDLGFKFYSLSDGVNGVLGQTYSPSYVSRVKVAAPMPVLGGDREFSSSDLFSTDCSVASFSGKPNGGYDHPDLDCSSGFAGAGVVCKR